MDSTDRTGRLDTGSGQAADKVQADLVRDHLAKLGINEQDIRDAVAWARKQSEGERSSGR